MIDKTPIEDLLGDGFAYIRASHWPVGHSVRTQDGGISLANGSWMPIDESRFQIDMDKPMSLEVARRLKASAVIATDTGLVLNDTDNCLFGSTPVFIYSKERVARITEQKARTEAKLQYLIEKAPFTYGFELETQSSDGMTHKNYSEGIPRHASQKVATMIKRGKIADLVKMAGTDDSTLRILEHAKGSLFEESIVITPEIHAHVVDIITKEGSSLPRAFAFPFTEAISVGYDSTVSGFELRTVGGISKELFSEALADVMQVQHEVDSKCSFHVHIGSNSDLALPTTREAHRQMIAFIVSDPRIPAKVRERWTNATTRDKWFPITGNGTEEKYAFIYNHRKYKTLEFRCFGNVSNAEDAEACRAVAHDAVVDALRSPKDIDPSELKAWYSTVNKILDSGKRQNLRDYNEIARRLELIEQGVAARRKELEDHYANLAL